MIRILLFVFISIALLPNTVPVYALERPEEVRQTAAEEKRLRAERRAREERERREARHDAADDWRVENLRTPTLREIEARIRRKGESELNRFRQDVGAYLRLATDIAYYRFAPLSERWASGGLAREAEQLGTRVNGLLHFLTDDDYDTPQVTRALTDSTTQEKLAILERRTFQISPKLISLTGDILDARVFLDVVRELLDIKVLTAALQR